MQDLAILTSRVSYPDSHDAGFDIYTYRLPFLFESVDIVGSKWLSVLQGYI
jgi:hypothetical protein